MRRKSERTASKKANASPEKKVEKVKRTRTRRKKQSSSSENESAEEKSPVCEVENLVVVEAEKKPPQTPVKEASPEEAQDQVWQVKTASDGSGDIGEIQKLKICLKRPPSTPERADRSPRSRRKHSRATSSSDTASVEAVETKKKAKHRSKRGRESKDDADKVQDSQEEIDTEAESQSTQKSSDGVVSQSEPDTVESNVETPVSTTTEENKPVDKEDKVESSEELQQDVVSSEVEDKISAADTTVVSPKAELSVVSPKAEPTVVSPKAETTVVSPTTETVPPQIEEKKQEPAVVVVEKDSPAQEINESIDKSEVLELHADDTRLESPEKEVPKVVKEDATAEDIAAQDTEVSRTEDKTDTKEQESPTNKRSKATNETGVVENSNNDKGPRKQSTDSVKDSRDENTGKHTEHEPEKEADKKIERSDSVQSQDEIVHNGQAAPIVVNRKRRWGSRPSKVTTQKSITISTDILKDIIPDVKPVEFEEVIEEKKHKRIEVSDRVERPVLPKIIIDNTENVEQQKEREEKDTMKPRESHLGANRKISIVKDTDSIIARPPSPPKHKQSSILYITNLVRPFTLPQLKNLLQRTGRIVENGFWIDRIKSKCFIKYENEDQAVETRHALHGVTWPVSNPKTLQVDFSNQEAFDKAKLNEDSDNAQASTIPGTVEDWLREQDMKRERGELEKPWERKAAMREWDVGKNEKEKDKDKEKDKLRRDERVVDKRRQRSIGPERSPEPARKFKKKEEEAPAKLLDDLFKKTKTTPCIYWLPLSAETIAVKEEQRRQHMAEHERRLQELRRTHRRH